MPQPQTALAWTHGPVTSTASFRDTTHISKPSPSQVKDSWSLVDPTRRGRSAPLTTETSTVSSARPPPPYVDPPSYAGINVNMEAKEPRTLPMYLFFLGFVCPILWIVGTLRMRLPHAHRRGVFDPWVTWTLSEEEKSRVHQESERRMKKWEVEMKWAKRCMWASIAFLCVGLVVGMAVWGTVSRRKD